MARLRSILVAVSKATARGNKSIWAASNNNMMYGGLTLMAMTDVQAFVFFLSIIALVIFLPSSGDPMARIPADRLALWPLHRNERLVLRLITPWLNPLTWLVLAGLLWKRVQLDLWLAVAGFFLAGFLIPSFHPRIHFTWAPSIPGPLRQLVRKNFRELWTALDLYCALLMAVPSLAFRLHGSMPAAAGAPLTMLILVMISTCTQTLFGLEGDSGMVRYQLLPLAGWKVLAAKGIAFLSILLLLTLHLAPGAALAGGFVALAIGQYFSIARRTPQAKWRFRASPSFGSSLGVMLPMLFATGAVAQMGAVWILPCGAIYLCSLWRCGKLFATRCQVGTLAG